MGNIHPKCLESSHVVLTNSVYMLQPLSLLDFESVEKCSAELFLQQFNEEVTFHSAILPTVPAVENFRLGNYCFRTLENMYHP